MIQQTTEKRANAKGEAKISQRSKKWRKTRFRLIQSRDKNKVRFTLAVYKQLKQLILHIGSFLTNEQFLSLVKI